MSIHSRAKELSLTSRILAVVISVVFSLTTIAPYGQTQVVPALQALSLPEPGSRVSLSSAFTPVLLKGLTLYPDNPLKFDFIFDHGEANHKEAALQDETEKLIRYFLASLTIPHSELWVNLSPHEGDRIIPDALAKTEMGRDLLAQDYLLKQLSASLIYPEDDLGEKFWSKVYEKSQELYGTTEIPVNTFNKVWIMPDSASVYEHDKTVYIVDSKMKVLMDSDYMAMKMGRKADESAMEIGADVIRELIIPEIEKEINYGKNFSSLRQIHHSLILAQWYKETIKESLLSEVYVDQNKTHGIDKSDAALKEQIYEQYMAAYKKGVFDFIKEEYDQLNEEEIPRKYFSGGWTGQGSKISQSVVPPAELIGENFTQGSASTVVLDPGQGISLEALPPTEKERLRQHGATRLDKNFDGLSVAHNIITSLYYNRIFHGKGNPQQAAKEAEALQWKFARRRGLEELSQFQLRFLGPKIEKDKPRDKIEISDQGFMPIEESPLLELIALAKDEAHLRQLVGQLIVARPADQAVIHIDDVDPVLADNIVKLVRDFIWPGDATKRRLGDKSIQQIETFLEPLGLEPGEVKILMDGLVGKVDAETAIARLKKLGKKEGQTVLVTAGTSPHPEGTGKSTLATLTAEALNHFFKTGAMPILRQDSLGVAMGGRKGASGGMFEPIEVLRTLLTGDFIRVEDAQNVILSTFYQQIQDGIIKDSTWVNDVKMTYSMDIESRELRDVSFDLFLKKEGNRKLTINQTFTITTAVELMATCAFASGLDDLREKVARIRVAERDDGSYLTVADLGIVDSIVDMLKPTLKPSLLQSSNGMPVLFHLGPFANKATGTAGIVSQLLGRLISPVTLVEAGFSAELGLVKYLTLIAQQGIVPDVVQAIATVRDIEHQGKTPEQIAWEKDTKIPKKKKRFTNLEKKMTALKKGLANLDAQLELIQYFQLPLVYTINRHESDTDEEIDAIVQHLKSKGVTVVVSDAAYHPDGSKSELSREVARVMKEALEESKKTNLFSAQSSFFPD